MNKKTNYDTDSLDQLVGKAALLKGEERVKFDNLQAAVSQTLRPADLFDAIDAREIASFVWETHRFQTMIAKVIDAKRRKALEILTSSMYGYISEKNEVVYASLAGEASGLTQREKLKKVGLSLELLNANSVLMAQQEIPMLEKLVKSRIASRKSHLRAYERRQRSKTKKADLRKQEKLKNAS